MKSKHSCLIKPLNLKNGNHTYKYKIDNKFFEGFEYLDFENVQLKTFLEIKKIDQGFYLIFQTKGTVRVLCDISNELFDLPISCSLNLNIKFGQSYFDDDEILILPYGTNQIDISKYIYEMVILSLPIKKMHPGIIEGSLNSDILQKLDFLKPKKNRILSGYHPRWKKLKDLL
ncbi:MAG: hypothetical protein CMC79_01540 [Flavobacteriaceae bacterium]|nr:hypothetical protein [Flavobacteriaceae bacterium]|tara:strand:+ start:23410 stop:23928 length:519 start_codon:yes stop_codon:yes gene_type:complete